MIGRIQTQRPDNPTAVFEAAVVGKQRRGENRKRVIYKGIARGVTREDALQRLINQIEVVLDNSWNDFPYFDPSVQHSGGGGSNGGGSGGNTAPAQGEKRPNNSDTDEGSGSKKKAKVKDQAEDREGSIAVDEGGEAAGNETKHAIQKAKSKRVIPVMSIAGGVCTSTL